MSSYPRSESSCKPSFSPKPPPKLPARCNCGTPELQAPAVPVVIQPRAYRQLPRTVQWNPQSSAHVALCVNVSAAQHECPTLGRWTESEAHSGQTPWTCRNLPLRSTWTSIPGILSDFCTAAPPPPPPQFSPPPPPPPAAVTAVKPHKKQTRSHQTRPPHSHQTPRPEPFDESSARMSWDWRALSHSTGRSTSTLFFLQGKVRKKTLEFLHLRREAIDSMRKQWNRGLGENLEDLRELEYQRSAPHPLLLNSVLGENLEDLRHLSADPEELECQQSARTQTLLNPVLREFPGVHASKRTSRQPPQVRTPPVRRHFHQLFRQLRIANSGSHRDIIRRDLGHFNNLLRIMRERAEELQDVRQLVPHLRHSIENMHCRSRAHEVDNVLGRTSSFGVLLVVQPEERLGRRGCPSSPALAVF